MGFYYEVPRGKQFEFDILITLDDVAQNLSGTTLWFTAKYDLSDSDTDAPIKKISTDAAQIALLAQSGGTLGMARVKLVPADTSGMSAYPRLLACDVQWKDGSNKYWQVDRGAILVSPDVTQRTT